MQRVERIDLPETGRRLGHDLYRFRHAVERPADRSWLVEGWTAAQAGRLRQAAPDRFVNKWLQLRVSAFRRGRVVDEQVTPAFLRTIDVARCPITAVVLTHGALADTDWSIDRLNNEGGYAPRNLAVMSVRANRAKGHLSFAEVHALARRGAATHGLTGIEWMRLASFMLGACHAGKPGPAPVIPLAAPIAPRTVVPGVQVLQYAFTSGASSSGGRNALVKGFGRLCPGDTSRLRLELFASALHQGLKRVDLAFDAWLQPDLMLAFERWHGTLDPLALSRVITLAKRSLDAAAVDRQAFEAWHLEDRGYVQ